jgi:hypothetical protein
MTLGARCAAETPERFSIYPGRTCGFAAKILHLAGTDPEVRRGADRLLLKVRADLERELEAFVLNCTTCGLDVHLGQRSRDHAGSLVACGARTSRPPRSSTSCPRDALLPVR